MNTNKSNSNNNKGVFNKISNSVQNVKDSVQAQVATNNNKNRNGQNANNDKKEVIV